MTDGHIERLERVLQEKDFELAVLRRAFEDYNQREKELRHCLQWFVSRDYYDRSISFEEAIRRGKRLIGGNE
jgi:hypothetical protein